MVNLMRRDQELAEAELAKRHMSQVESTTYIEEESGDFTFEEYDTPPPIFQETVPEGKRLFGYAPELPPEDKRVPCAVCNGTKLYHDGSKCHVCLGTGFGWKDNEHQICMRPVYIDYEATIIDLSSHYIKGDSIAFMNDVGNAERFDHIICDIPYGIDIENIDQHVGIKDIEIIKDEHTVEGNKQLFKDFFPAAFKCLKPNAFLITWCDAMLWQEMYDIAIGSGFKVQRWPFIWVKDYPCLNQMAQYNFTKSTEFAMVCRKGLITLPEKQSTNYIVAGRDEMQDELKHPFAKPFECWKRLIEAVSIENQSILDPFAGRCSSLLSGIRLGRDMYGVEINDAHYNAGLEHLKQFYTKLNPRTVFK
jgi:DNA modification methylase